MKIYLASKYELFDIRKSIIKKYSSENFKIIDPIETNKNNISHKEIIDADKKLILDCDILVAYIEEPSFGTAMEILYAHENNITVYIINPNEKYIWDYWLTSHCNVMCTDVDKLFDWLKDVYNQTRTTV